MPTCVYSQAATTGFHRVSQILSRANTGVTAQVVPYASVFVTNQTTGAVATIYSDPLLSVQIVSGMVTADSNGNYSYYIPSGYCVHESISSPGQGSTQIDNICVPAGGGSGTVIGQANGIIPLATGTTIIGAQSPLSVVSGNVVNSGGYTGPTVSSSVNNQINVQAPGYGAKGNLTQFTGGSMAANSSTLVGTGFTSSMVGEEVIIWGAGQNNGTSPNPNYGPIITTVQTFVNSTHLTLATTATTAIPNATSNPAGNFEIGNDDTTAIQAAYCFAASNRLPLYFPPTLTGTSYLLGGLDLSCSKTTTFLAPISGNSQYVATITGKPGEPIFYWPDGYLGSGFNTLSSFSNFNLQVDASIDTSCANSVGATCTTMADGQPAINRVSGYLIPAKGVATTWTSTGSSVTVTVSGTPWATTSLNGPYMSGGIVNFQSCTSGLSALNWTGSNSYPVTSGTSNTVTFLTSLIGAGSGSDTCSVFGGTPAPINVGQSGNLNGGTLTFNSGDSDYDLVNIGSSTLSAGRWEFIGQPFQINHNTTGIAIYTGTISAVISGTQVQVSGGGCAACFATSTAYSASGTAVTLTESNSYSVGDTVKIAAISSDPLFAINGVTETITSASSTQIVFNSTAISAGSGSTAATTLLTGFPYYFGSTSIQAPPWYVGNSAFSFPASAALGGNVPRLFENINISQIGGGANNTNHTAGFFFQEPPYASTFRHIFVNQTQYCYVEAPYTTNNAVTWTPDTMQMDNFNCTDRVGPIFYAGNIRNIRSLSIYTGATYFTYGMVNLNGPLNHAGGSVFSSLYHEPGTGNFGEDLTFYGTGFTFSGPSWHQGLAGYVNYAAANSNIHGGSGGEYFNETTSAMRLNSSGNIFTNFSGGGPASNGSYGGSVQDIAGGNIVIGNDVIGPAYYNLPPCIPGQSDFGFLNVNPATPYASQCSLRWDYTTLSNVGVGANVPAGASYVQSTPGDGNPTAGYLYFPSTISSGASLNNQAFPMNIGTIVPIGTMNVELTGYVGTPGNYTVLIHDVTANTTLTTCVYAMTSTTANHGYPNSVDSCTLTTNSGETGHRVSVSLSTAPSAVGGVHLAFVALVPQSATVSATVTNLQAPAWLTYLGDGTDGALSVSSGSRAVTNNGEKWYSSLSIASGATLYYTANSSPTIIRVTGGCNIAGTISVSTNSSSFPGNPSSTQLGSSGGGGGGGTGAGTAGSQSVPNATAGAAGAASGGTGGNGVTVLNTAYRPLIADYTTQLAVASTVLGGAAGGAGGSTGGAGGEGGGALILACNALSFTGTLDASGGAGTAAAANNTGGGGGGGGGLIIVRSPNITTNTGTINVSGGAGGGCSTFTGCGPGGNGGNGWSYVIPF